MMSPQLKSSLIVLLLLASGSLAADQGLKGEYFANMNLAGQPALTRIEAVKFNWGGASPGDPIGVDTFSVRWTGSLTPPETGSYTFGTRTDDGVRLWVAGELTVNNWTDHSATMNRGQPLQLQAGEPVAVTLEFYENGGDAVCELYWSGPGIAEEMIPAAFLSPTIVVDLRARKPKPANGALNANAPLLEWTAGEKAMFHNVYLGTSPLLTEADRVATMQALPLVFYYHVPGLTPGATYYWRVDEVEKDAVTTHTGAVWSFVAQALTAYYPDPVDTADDVSVTPVLTWLPGSGAVKHQVFFSSNQDAVAQGAAGADKGVLVADVTSFAPGTLDSLTPYYWRVDEILDGGVVRAGEVWSFTTTLPVDDFESYTDDIDAGQTIYQTWIDGVTTQANGSTVGYLQAPFAEQVIVHGGLQSMPLDFNNINAPYYSEAEREFAANENWTAGGANTLVLYIRGKVLNPAETLYITLQDSSQKTATVKHPNPAIIKSGKWNPWRIPLTEFTGVNATRIKKIYIGVGDKAAPAQGGAGLIYIDDIGVAKGPSAP